MRSTDCDSPSLDRGRGQFVWLAVTVVFNCGRPTRPCLSPRSREDVAHWSHKDGEPSACGVHRRDAATANKVLNSNVLQEGRSDGFCPGDLLQTDADGRILDSVCSAPRPSEASARSVPAGRHEGDITRKSGESRFDIIDRPVATVSLEMVFGSLRRA